MTKPPAIRNIDSEGGFSWINNIIIEKYLIALGPYGLAVYTVLAKFANNNTQQAFPSTKTIARTIGISSRQVVKEIQRLERFRLISVQRRSSTGSSVPNTSNLYTLLHPTADWEADAYGDQMSSPHEGHSCEGGESESSEGVNTMHTPYESRSLPHAHSSGRYEHNAHKQDSITRLNNKTDSTTRVAGDDVHFPGYFETLLTQLEIKSSKSRQSVYSRFQEDEKTVITWAVVLTSQSYCERHNIRSPSGLFLTVVKKKTPSPALQLSSSMDACQYCGNTGSITLSNGSKQEDLRLACCPICGILPRTSKWDIAIF